MHTPFDSKLYGDRYGTPAMKAIWSDDGIVQSWLDFEVALAEVQAELGLIPVDAAAAIRDVATLEHLDWERLGADTRRVGMAIKPLVDQLSDRGGAPVRDHVHWGATTQDVLDSGQALRLKASIDLLTTALAQTLERVIAMADLHRNTVMVGRTNAQDAAPITWGLHVSTYATELARHLDRLAELRKRACMGMFGGAVGTLASLGPKGLHVRDRLLDRLGLTRPKGLWNASLDGVVELIQWTALVHGTLQRVANDVENLSRSAVGELREGEDGGGSSTMPHKGNPRAANTLQALAQTGFMLAGSAHSLLDQADVRAAAARSVSWTLVPESMMVLSASLDRCQVLLQHLQVNPERMRANFTHSKNFVLSEAVMMHMARQLGRGEAYALVKTALAAHAAPDRDLRATLLASPEVLEHVSAETITGLCDAESYLGHTQTLIDEALDEASRALTAARR